MSPLFAFLHKLFNWLSIIISLLLIFHASEFFKVAYLN